VSQLSAPSRRKSRWLTFSLRGFLIVCVFVSAALGTVGQSLYKIRRQRAIIEKIQECFGTVTFRHEVVGTSAALPGPTWLRHVLGDDALFEPIQVTVCDQEATQAIYDSLALLPSLETVHIHSGSVSAAELASVARIPRLSSLTLNSRVEPGSLAALAQAKLLHDLQMEDQHRSFADDSLRGVGAVSSLRRIDLYGTAVTAAGLKHLTCLKNLRRLDLGACSLIADDDLSCLLELTSLESLRLEETNAGDAALASLAEHRGITKLELGFSEISDAGLRQIAGMPQLQSLDLTCTRITHAGLAHLTELPNLRLLNCYRCTLVRDEATPILAQMKQLRALNLEMTLITQSAADSLRRELTLDEFTHKQFVKDW